MTEQKSGNDHMIKCEICMKEVPQSEARSAEAKEYVMHFCGLDCYSKWEETKTKPRKEE